MNPVAPQLLLAGLVWTCIAASAAEPFQPDRDDLVLVKLPVSSGLHRPLAPGATPSLPHALSSARALLRLAREDGDPRLLGRAQALLGPWWGGSEVTTDTLLLRAEIKQSLHAFSSALEDLDLALQREPRNAGAWLLKATLHQVLGDYASAQRTCLRLAQHSDPLSAMTAAASLRSLTDPSPDTARQLAAVIQRNTNAPTEVLAWSWTTLGEIQARHGDATAAENSFRAALRLQPKSPYTIAALADLWLSTGRPLLVLELLGDTTSDPLRLRVAEAWSQAAPEAQLTRQLVSELAATFALGQLRGEELHLREFARFVLRLQKQPTLALSLARRNWSIQKEPADLALLLEAADAAKDHQMLAQLEAWAMERHVVLRRTNFPLNGQLNPHLP